MKLLMSDFEHIVVAIAVSGALVFGMVLDILRAPTNRLKESESSCVNHPRLKATVVDSEDHGGLIPRIRIFESFDSIE